MAIFCKMITDDAQLVWDTSDNSLCQFVLQGLNVPDEEKTIMWQKCQHMILITLNRKRNEVTGRLKQKHKGECNVWL